MLDTFPETRWLASVMVWALLIPTFLRQGVVKRTERTQEASPE